MICFLELLHSYTCGILNFTDKILYKIYVLNKLKWMFAFYCRNNRRGSTPLILGNLCVSLLGLLLALYVAERLAHTYNGCRVANLLRYYFVMVSLFWNGVEAVNMYMKLVKVFNSHVSHLVLKAAIVAWGQSV